VPLCAAPRWAEASRVRRSHFGGRAFSSKDAVRGASASVPFGVFGYLDR
jgi:hypothetical protein